LTTHTLQSKQPKQLEKFTATKEEEKKGREARGCTSCPEVRKEKKKTGGAGSQTVKSIRLVIRSGRKGENSLKVEGGGRSKKPKRREEKEIEIRTAEIQIANR